MIIRRIIARCWGENSCKAQLRKAIAEARTDTKNNIQARNDLVCFLKDNRSQIISKIRQPQTQRKTYAK